MIPVFEPRIKMKYALQVFFQIMSGWVGSGETVVAFENEIKHVTGAKHAISTTSGTTALLMAVSSLDLAPGSTVLFPAYTFLAGANACRFLGYNVRLVDIKEDTLCMDPDMIEVAGDVSAVIFVNHNGYVGEDVLKTRRICDENSIRMVEDASQGIGIDGAGLTGDLGVFSFSVPKLITTGQGGVVFTDRDDLARRCRRIRDHGEDWRETRTHNHLGANFKYNDILASYGLGQLGDIGKLLKIRKQIFGWYREHIDIVDYGYESTWAVIYRTQKADEIISNLNQRGFQAVRYYKPINWNPPYDTGEKFPVAEKVHNEIINLPSSLTLKRRHVERICQTILETENA